MLLLIEILNIIINTDIRTDRYWRFIYIDMSMSMNNNYNYNYSQDLKGGGVLQVNFCRLKTLAILPKWGKNFFCAPGYTPGQYYKSITTNR